MKGKTSERREKSLDDTEFLRGGQERFRKTRRNGEKARFEKKRREKKKRRSRIVDFSVFFKRR
jgi:hypothetical protein